ncbi:hypothetical protein Pmani_003633 [Petrolisthes manimaculis]|uniref:SWIM-type domain-containing protein n=1 Tax=Petrolisthes manimaculis TaxID=1843537 RepID=A0AAE1QF87_9EUCA|nr:hypothetical protein Pmani_003633 [Petrolisthes manimaculis]
MKCHKSLKAHNFFTSGWVKEVNVAPTTGLDSPGSSQSSPVIVRGRVLHSQSLSATPTNTWIIVAQDGGIMTANCDCKAGLGGTCSHVGAVLFYVDAAVRAREQKTVTQDKAYWLLPKACKKVEYKPISEIDFTSSANRKRKFDAQLCDPTAQSSDTVVKRQSCDSVKPPTEAEKTKFLEDLYDHGSRAVILSVTKPFNKAFIPKAVSMASQLPEPLSVLRKDDSLMKDRSELKKNTESVCIVITEDQVRAVESLTRTQSKSNLWYTHRAGRITSSSMKNACATKVETPSLSLINKVALRLSVHLVLLMVAVVIISAIFRMKIKN